MTNPSLSRSIAGRVAIITGAASGMGRATAQLFAAEAEAGGLAEGLPFQGARDQGGKQERRVPDRLRAGLPAGHPGGRRLSPARRDPRLQQ